MVVLVHISVNIPLDAAHNRMCTLKVEFNLYIGRKFLSLLEIWGSAQHPYMNLPLRSEGK